MTPFTKEQLESMYLSLEEAIYQVEADYNSEFDNREEAQQRLNDLDNIAILLQHLITQAN